MVIVTKQKTLYMILWGKTKKLNGFSLLLKINTMSEDGLSYPFDPGLD